MIDLPQAEANLGPAMEKHRINDDKHSFGALRLEIPLQSADQRENFLLDIGRGRIRTCSRARRKPAPGKS